MNTENIFPNLVLLFLKMRLDGQMYTDFIMIKSEMLGPVPANNEYVEC